MDTHVTIKQEDIILSNLMSDSTNKEDFMMKLGQALFNEIEELKTPTVITISVR